MSLKKFIRIPIRDKTIELTLTNSVIFRSTLKAVGLATFRKLNDV